METKSSKQFGEWVTSLWYKYRTDIFFRTTCHIIILQVILTIIVITGLWFIAEYLVRGTSQTLINTFTQILQGENVTSDIISEELKDVQYGQFWPVTVMAIAVILSFGFIMVYVSLTPTRRSLERKKRFISNISHELRTPLAIIRTNTDVALLDSATPAKTRDVLERNIVELERISDMMNNLLGLTNLMQNGQVKFEEVDLNAVAKRAIDSLLKDMDCKDVVLTFKSHTDQFVIGNATALEQVAFNLIKNAIVHRESSGTVVTVEIEADASGKYIDLTVKDTGSGISRQDLFHVLEPFYRNRKNNKGQGLGLAIVNEIVQIHRGKIRIQSTLGKGTVVTVSIKRSEEGEAKVGREDHSNMDEISMDFSRKLLH